MATLPQTTPNFNRQVKLSYDGGELSSDTGGLLFREFDEKIGFPRTLADYLHLNDERLYHFHTNENLLRQKLLDKVHHHRKSETLIFDLDSTHADTYGEQESSSFNTHYGTVGFHQLVAFDGATRDFLKAKLRPGNVYTSNGVVDFVEPLISHYNETFPETTPFLRGDSGFAVPKLHDLCEKESVYCVIRLKSNPNNQRLANDYHPSTAPSDITRTARYFEETTYQAQSWTRPRKVIIQSVRPAGELFFTHSFFVTNLTDAFTPESIVRSYQKRGTMENYIKEAKNGFNLDRMSSHSFQANEARMMLSLLAYNLTNWMRTLCFPEKQKSMQIQTIRTRIIKVASKLVKSSRSFYFKLASSFVYQAFFKKVLRRIQAFQLEMTYVYAHIHILKSIFKIMGDVYPKTAVLSE